MIDKAKAVIDNIRAKKDQLDEGINQLRETKDKLAGATVTDDDKTAIATETDVTDDDKTKATDEAVVTDDVAADPQSVSLKLALFGGAGIGALFGFIMGTSITPTVATILGALTGMLAGILGLNDGNFGNAKAVRIGGFGFACVLTALFGLFVRSHNLMSPSLLSLKQQYVELGFSEAQALDFVAQKEFGVSLAAFNPQPPPGDPAVVEGAEGAGSSAPVVVAAVAPASPSLAEQIHKQHSSLLFSAPVDLSSCDELEGTDETLALDDIIGNFELTGEMWETAALVATEQIAPAQQKAVMLATKAIICSSGEIDDAACERLKPLVEADSHSGYQLLSDAFKVEGEDWQQLLQAVELRELSEADKQQTLFLMANTLCGI